MRTSKKRKINVEWQRAALGQREIIRILFVFGAILILFMVVNNIPKLIHFSERIQSKASGTEAGIVNLVLGFAFLFVWVIILRLAFRGNLLQAVAIFIMFFPIVQRFTRVYAVTVYSSPFSGSRIMISLTTVTVVLIFFALFHTKGKMLKYEQRPNGLTRLLLVYFLFVLIIQLFHHPPYTALMICFVSLLQPFLFYFVIINVVRKKEDIILIFSSYIVSLIFGIMLRFTQGIGSYQIGSRLSSSGAFGQSIPYAQLLTWNLPILMALYMITSDESKRSKFFIFGILLSLFEFLATGTRGPIFALPALLCFFLYKKSRKKIFIIFILSIFLLMAVWPLFENIFQVRKLYLDSRIFTLHSVSYRFEIDYDAILKVMEKPFIGYGIGESFTYEYSELEERPHNMYVSIAVMSGIGGLLLFLFILLKATHNAVQGFKKAEDEDIKIIALSLIASFFAFFMGTMTSGGSFLYTPNQEWKLMFFINLAISTILVNRLLPQKNKNKDLSPLKMK